MYKGPNILLQVLDIGFTPIDYSERLTKCGPSACIQNFFTVTGVFNCGGLFATHTRIEKEGWCKETVNPKNKSNYRKQ